MSAPHQTVELSVPSIHCASCKDYLSTILTICNLDNLLIDVERKFISFEGPHYARHIVTKTLANAGYHVASDLEENQTHLGVLGSWGRSWLSRRRARSRKINHLKHCSKCQTEKGLISLEPETPIEEITVIQPSSIPQLTETTFGVEGMTCASCSHAIESALSSHPAIQSLNIQVLQNSMKVVYDASALSPTDIVGMTGDCGFEATEWETRRLDMSTKEQGRRKLMLKIDGIFSDQCSRRLNDHFKTLPVQSFTPLSPTNAITTITYEPTASLTVRSILKSLPDPFSGTVYQPPSFHSRSRAIQAREAIRLTQLLFITTAFAVPTFVIGIVGVVLLPEGTPFHTWCEMQDVWGGVTRGVIFLWILATPVQFGIGRYFYERAFSFPWNYSAGWRKWRPSKFIRPNMDLLVALSTTVAYVASVVLMVLDIRSPVMEPESKKEMDTYFDSCVFLMLFILMGRVLEGRARVSTGDAIAMLGKMSPERALLITRSQGAKSLDNCSISEELDTTIPDFGSIETTEIPVNHLELGDHILLRPGQTPPADATILFGTTTADESSLTGESLPVPKQIGDKLFTGTTNISSAVVLRVDALGDETALQKIVRAVVESQNRKAPIELLADRITAVFVPAIVALALIVLTIWLGLALSNSLPTAFYSSDKTSSADRIFFAFQFFIAVMVIACPCGIGLAAPTAQAVGTGMCAEMGVLAQGGGEAFQRASMVDAVVFDKTGTLTTGETTVVDEKILWPEGEAWIHEALRLLENGSTHPLARALVEHCEEKALHSEKPKVVLLASEELVGKGARGTIKVDNRDYHIFAGNEALVKGAAYSNGSDDSILNSWKSQGKSIVLVALQSLPLAEVDQMPLTIVARFSISDTPRPEAAAAIASLRKSGKEVFMLSGDNRSTATAVAKQVGIAPKNVIADVLPGEKADFIRSLQAKPRTRRTWWGKKYSSPSSVLFCGDGLNDSAAIASADIGIALSHGSQVTMTNASFVLLQSKSSLTTINSLLNLSRKVYIRQKVNFAWAMVYNIILIPVAAGAFYALWSARIPPVWAALAMALSSLSVVTSSLALKWGL